MERMPKPRNVPCGALWASVYFVGRVEWERRGSDARSSSIAVSLVWSMFVTQNWKVVRDAR